MPYIRLPTGAGVWNSGQAQQIENLADTDIKNLGFPTRAELSAMAESSPGSYWYLSGELNRYGHISGTRFAPVFNYLATNLKAGDSTAKIVSPSILNWDFICVGCQGYQGGELWLKEFIAAYQGRYGVKPPVDVWAIDAYPIDWLNTPNNDAETLFDPESRRFPTYKGEFVLHSEIVVQQLLGMRQYLNTVPEYLDTPIWITEIAVHVGYDGWKFGPGFSLEPVGKNCVDTSPSCGYNWDHMSEYLVQVLDWLEINGAANKIEKWFFYRSWRDIVNVGSDGYMGIIFFDGPESGASLNCLGEVYRARALGEGRWKCDSAGNTVRE